MEINKICVDLDGTIADFSNSFSRYLATQQDKYILNRDVFKHFDLYKEFEKSRTEECFNLPLYPNSKEVLKQLHNNGKHLMFLTSRGMFADNPETKSKIEIITMKWKEEHFPFVHSCDFSRQKHEYAKNGIFDLMIEDDPNNANSIAEFRPVILMSRSWNRDFELKPNVIVSENWDECKWIIENSDKFFKN